MHSFRTLKPALAIQGQHQAGFQKPFERGPAAKASKRRTRHTADEWAAVKKEVLRLYATHSLDQVSQLIKEQRGFEAG